MNEQLLTAVLAAAGCGVVAAFGPTVIARLPEPAPEPEPETPPETPPDTPPAKPRPPKVPYSVVAGGRALAWRIGVVAAVVGGLIGHHFGWSWGLLVLLPLVPLGVTVAVVDWLTQTIPTRLMWPAYVGTIGTVVVASLAVGEPRRILWAAIGWAAIGGLFFVLWFVYPPGMGYGDVRLAGVVGIALGFLGFPSAFLGLMAGLLLGGLGGLLLSLLRIVDRRNVPFGPFILLGAFLGCLVA